MKKSCTFKSRLGINRVALFFVLILNTCILKGMAQVVLVAEGEPKAVVVIAENPTETAKYAAEELVSHVKMATGAALKVIKEPALLPGENFSRIYIGETNAALNHSIDFTRLPRESFIMRSVGNDLFIVGRESALNPLSRTNPHAGTLFGVYEFLDHYLGVRWLWPGPLGTYVPRTTTLKIPSVNLLKQPAFLFRELMWHRIRHVVENNGISEEDARLGFTPGVAKDYCAALEVLFRRHQMGGMDIKPKTTHHIADWWTLYGEEHPGWFVLCRDGTRGNPRAHWDLPHVSLCVSNDSLQDFIVEQWDGHSILQLGETDAGGRCLCEKCRSWDGPQPENPPFFAKRMYTDDRDDVFYGQTPDRYAKFWKIIYQKAKKRNPDVQVSVSFLYNHEFTAPVTGIKLNKNIYGEFVPWIDPYLRHYPMPSAAFEWVKEQWLGWQKTGMRMGYRPNYLHDGYVLPHFDTWQSGEFLKFAYKNGMEGGNFDMYTGQWAVQGLRLYMHLRLLTDPELPVGEIRQEYFSAFGPAANTIERYFDYWENYAIENVYNFIEKLHTRRYAKYPLQAHMAFPPEFFEPAKKMLEQASKEAKTSQLPEFAKRVEFLEVGLQHALLTLKLAAIHDGRENVPEDQIPEAKKALQELVDFRKAHEKMYFSDLYHVTNFWERPNWNMDYFFE